MAKVWANEIGNEVKVVCIIGNKNDLKEVISHIEVEIEMKLENKNCITFNWCYPID